MRERGFRLRTVLTVLTVCVTSLALTVLVLLLIVTQYSNRVSAALAGAIENVRASEETQIALLVHERARATSEERQAEDEMLRNLAAIRQGASQNATAAVARAEALVDKYLQGARSSVRQRELPEDFAAAFRMLDEVSDLNVEEARVARERAARWERRLDLLGTVAVAIVLTLAGSVLWWTRTHAIEPVRELARAMERFGRGEHDVRAEARGPAELRDMVDRFNQMVAELGEQRHAQVAFLAGVAHDLKNPISALSLSVALIDPSEPLPPEPRIRRTLELVRRQLGKLERMANDFMDMTRVEAGQLELHTSAHDFAALVREVVHLFEATEPEQRIELTIAEEPLILECDALRIEQVVSNLISNAIKYSPRTERIEVNVTREDAQLCLRVRDYGVGISAEDQLRVFEPFRRAGLGKDGIPGAGLGLYVVQRLVAAHGGRIDVNSSPGAGSCFTVCLPTTLPPSASAAATHAAPAIA